MNDRAGFLRANLTGEAAYSSFVPSPLPPRPSIAFDRALTEALVRANRQLALLDGIASRLPDVRLFISMYVRKEALMSSQIEGTQATLEDVLDPSVAENANLDVGDVVRYIRATEFAIRRLADLPLSGRLLRETHAVLLEGVRGQEKNPGEFRRSQNWIGGQGSTLKNARYIPPSPKDMAAAMSDLEKYMNADDALDPLIRAGLIHYQFETIHPFLDGNGRVGRLLITLYLMEKRVLQAPILYISYFLKKNRVEYYDRMSEVRRSGNYEQWIRFFLESICESAADAIATIDRLHALRECNAQALSGLGRGAATAMRLFAYLEANPIVEIQRTADALGISFNTASAGIRRLCDVGILTQSPKGGKRRRRVFAYKAYLDLLREGT